MAASPVRPTIAVGAVILDEAARVVLVRRSKPPLAGCWTIPGGAVEIAEPLAAAAEREALEETGLDVEVGPLVEVHEHVSSDAAGQIEFHYVILDYVCRIRGGSLAAGSDAADAVFVAEADLDQYLVNDATRAVVRRALEVRWPEPGRHPARLTRNVPDTGPEHQPS
jgi:ADP-ribose pyrophosphatase YjhB (NUDIX family)